MKTRSVTLLIITLISILIIMLNTCTAPPPVGGARNFVYLHGSNYLEIPHTADLDRLSTGDFTVEGWFSSQGAVSEELSALFMLGNDLGENTLGLYHDADQGNMWALFVNDRLAGLKESSLNTGDGAIHFMLFSYTDSIRTYRLYLDGELFMKGSADLPLDFQNSNLLIGADYDGPNTHVGNLWWGNIYEWRLWSSDSDSAAAAFKHSHPNKLTEHYSPNWQNTLLALWRMDAENGEVPDDSPNSSPAFIMEFLNKRSISPGTEPKPLNP